MNDHDAKARQRMRTRVAGFGSFTEREVFLLDSVVHALVMGREPPDIRRRPEAHNIARKVRVMRRQVAERKELRDRIQKHGAP